MMPVRIWHQWVLPVGVAHLEGWDMLYNTHFQVMLRTTLYLDNIIMLP